MGRTPEQVYRYALRRDQPDRSLTDGCGFSIVLVNDESEVCRDILLRYFTQLSHRTDNRVRFIFFAEMTQAESVQRQAGGRFGFDWVQRRVGPDNDATGWQELQPEALELVSDPKETLAAWVDQSAVPDNAGAAIRFAQRLGVAEHVPCLLIFTDVGDLSVYVMPIARLSAEEVFKHVCYWVDQFYKDNRGVLARWDDAEKQIAALHADVTRSLAVLDKWRDSTRARGRQLREIAEAIRVCEALGETAPEKWPARIGEMTRAVGGRGVRGQLDAFVRSINTLTTMQDLQTRATRAGEKLRDADTREGILEALEQLVATRALIGSDESALRRAIEELYSQLAEVRSRDPEQRWLEWRRSVPKQPDSLEYSVRTRSLNIVRPDRQTNDEYALLIQQLRLLTVKVEPEAGARSALEKVASRFGGPDLQRWWDESAPVLEMVQSYLQTLLAKAPDWFDASPELTIGQALGPKKVTAPSGQVLAAVERQRERQADATRAAAGRILANTLAVKDQGLAALAAALPMYETNAEHWRATVDRHVALLRSARDVIERELDDSVQAAAGGRPARRAEPEQLRQLRVSLDRYDEAIASLTYPHEGDALVIRVPIETSVPQAADLTPVTRGRPSEDVRTRLEAAATGDSDLGPSFDAGMVEAECLQPAGSLKRALRATVTAARLEELVDRGGDRYDVLWRLTTAELALMRDSLGLPGGDPGTDRDSRIAEILAAIGADPCEKRNSPPGAYDFDVFLSYHSPNQADVESIARALENRGLKPWLDCWHIRPGAEVRPTIEAAIRRCRAVAMVIGSDGIGPWQDRELLAAYEALKRGLPLVPVLLGSGSRVDALPVHLQRYSYVRLASAADPAGIDRLTWGLTPVPPAAI